MNATKAKDMGLRDGRALKFVPDVWAGCFQCFDSKATWFGHKAIAKARRHHLSTGHSTWADVTTSMKWGVH